MEDIRWSRYGFVYGLVLRKDTLLECGFGNGECGFFKGLYFDLNGDKKVRGGRCQVSGYRAPVFAWRLRRGKQGSPIKCASLVFYEEFNWAGRLKVY